MLPCSAEFVGQIYEHVFSTDVNGHCSTRSGTWPARP
jgi:hypothetical protein